MSVNNHMVWCLANDWNGSKPCNCGAEAHSLQRHGSVTPDALIVAFVQGAQWWEYHKSGATMWGSDRDEAEGAAQKRAANGTLGKSPNAPHE